MQTFREFIAEEGQYEVAYQHFGKNDRLVTKSKKFKTAKQREKFADKISQHPKFHSIYGYRDPEKHELKEAFGQKPAEREYGDEHLSRYAQHIVNDHEREYQGKPIPEHNRMSVSFEHGPKYTRVVTAHGPSRSAHSFIDPKGNIYKSASWKTPAKNFTRGHITDAEHKRVSWTGAH